MRSPLLAVFVLGCGPGSVSDGQEGTASTTTAGSAQPGDTSDGSATSGAETDREPTDPPNTSTTGDPLATSDGADTSGDVDSSSSGEPPPPVECPDDDTWEPNDAAEMASLHDQWDPGDNGFDVQATGQARLCAGTEDWYLFPVSALELEKRDDPNGFYHFRFFVVVEGNDGECSGCDEHTLPASPDNTVRVEAYNTETSAMLLDFVSDVGRVYRWTAYGQVLEGEGDILVRVSSPTPTAAFNYEFGLRVVHDAKPTKGECEC